MNGPVAKSGKRGPRNSAVLVTTAATTVTNSTWGRMRGMMEPFQMKKSSRMRGRGRTIMGDGVLRAMGPARRSGGGGALL